VSRFSSLQSVGAAVPAALQNVGAAVPAALRRARIRPVEAPAPKRFRRLRIVLGVSCTFGVLFGAVVLRTELLERQRRLDHLHAEIVSAKERQYSLRRQETLLRSPQDVAEIATKELGMVPPERAVLVTPEPVHIRAQGAAPAQSHSEGEVPTAP